MEEIQCKKCSGREYTRNGWMNGKQRYRCKGCGCNFTNSPRRGRSAATKALALLLYSMGKGSYRWIGQLLDVSDVAVYKWIRHFAKNLPEPQVEEGIVEMELDEMWHFLEKKRKNSGSGRPMLVTSAAVSPGWLAVVTLLPLKNSGEK